MVPQMTMPPRRSLSTSTASNVLPYGHRGTISSFQTRNTSLDESVYQGSYTPDGRGLVEGYYPYPPTLPALPTKPGSEQYKRNQLTVRRILLIVGVLVVLATILAIVAVVVTHKPLPSTTDGPPAPPKSTPNANCKTTLFDDFTRPNTNNVGLVTGAGGDIQALAWTSNLTFFPSGYTGYYYENVRDVIIADNGTTTTCKAAPSFGRYVAFSMAGSGTFHINVQVGCAKVVHKSAAFNLTASPPTDFVIDVDRLAGVGASADLSAVVWENMVFADRGVSWSLADFRGVSDVDDCGLAGATMIP
ncbi:hypothetical protein DFJ73DRAFT_854664 [Zopfochytrium polystomum]|nr:hypothetical protein DFJ73DRAFT_854664 [Zopfochytrium polystomum]